jgi:hypothetical protein
LFKRKRPFDVLKAKMRIITWFVEGTGNEAGQG